MNCTKCKAQWTPQKNQVVTNCPFCGEHLFAPKIDGKPAEPHLVLLEIVRQFGSDTLGQSRLKGLLADLMPNAEKRHLRILRQAVDDGIGARLLDMQSDTHAVRTLKITTLKENFRNNNAFNHTADYVVDCFLFALGWLEHPPKEDVNSAQVNTLNILQHTVEMAFTDGRLTKEEAKSIFTLANTLRISEDEANRLIIEKLKAQNYKPEKAIDKTLKTKKEIILSQNWVLNNNVKTQEEYESVKIGTQVWMKRNLDVSHFRNGDPIPEAKTNEEWEKADEEKKPAWCYYGNDPKNGKIYGKLYNWYAVNDPRGLAPEGWHIPNNIEWQGLVDFLGGEKIAGGKMKSTGTSEWKHPNEGATNSSGFSGLPGGYRYNVGYFKGIGLYGNWWSSTEYSLANAWYSPLNYTSNNTYSYNHFKGLGFSVRCVKDSVIQEKTVSTPTKTKSIESVTIGNQIWMKRNLDVSYFRNGDPIPEAKSNEEWEKAGEEKKPAWCYYGNDPINGKIYGKLYNWYAVNDSRGLAPKGWHVPSDNEWQVLVDFLGGEEIAGGKMKTIGTSEWKNPNEGATNISGFTGLPGGYRYYNGSFYDLGSHGYWWSSSENYPFYRNLNYCDAGADRVGYIEERGWSVRCIRDKDIQEKTTSKLTTAKTIESVKIGNQEWMKRNLDVSHFRNGDPIPEARTAEEWRKAGEEGKPAWCYYNNISENGKHYGKLYNWFAVNNLRGLAPYGWKIPSDEEIIKIADFSGEEYYVGTELTSKDGWEVISNYFTALYEKMEATGNAVVTRIRDTKNPEIKILYAAQLRDDVNSADASEENSIFLGWGSGSSIIRATRAFKPSVFNAEVGTVLPESVNIQVEDQVGSPFYDGQEPRKRPNNGTVITKNGEPIYRNIFLVAGEPVHTIISDFDRETTDAQYGVTAIPGGSRKMNGGFEFAVFGVMWSSCVESSGFAYACYFDPFSMKINKVKVEKGYGFSVRCVKE